MFTLKNGLIVGAAALTVIGISWGASIAIDTWCTEADSVPPKEPAKSED